jgi:hypothetical protein
MRLRVSRHRETGLATQSPATMPDDGAAVGVAVGSGDEVHMPVGTETVGVGRVVLFGIGVLSPVGLGVSEGVGSIVGSTVGS